MTTSLFGRLACCGALLLGLAVFASSAHGLSCGDIVTGHVVLISDLNCTLNGLFVGADHTTIDLNGYTISCSDPAGYLGSCQNLLPSQLGVASNGHSHVKIKGPGTITGFGVGVRLAAGTNLKVKDLLVTGPASPDAATNGRLLSVGVVIVNTACAHPHDTAAEIHDNEISNHLHGIQLSNAFCVSVVGNYIHDNNGMFGDAHGIDVIASGNNAIHNNLIERNGTNKNIDSGISLLNADAANNTIEQNDVSNNCGDGIAARNGAHDNEITKNVARFNGTNTLDGQCVAPIGPIFFDLADRLAGPGNVWDPNNQCLTQSVGIPPGVCNPGE
jgi:parallel beta-helix repeat protein